MNKTPEEIFLDYLDDKNWILSGTSPLSEDQESYTLTSLTDRRDAVDELIDATRQLMIMRDDDGELSAEAGETIQAILEARNG